MLKAVLLVLHLPRDMFHRTPILYENRIGDEEEGYVITKPCVYAAPVYSRQIVKHRLLRGPKDNIIFIRTNRPAYNSLWSSMTLEFCYRRGPIIIDMCPVYNIV